MKNDWATLYDSPRTPAIAAFMAAPAVWMAVRSPTTMYSGVFTPIETALAVPDRVREVLRRRRRLVLVVTPRMKDVAAVGMDVDEAADPRVVVEQPTDVPRLGLRERSGAMEQVVPRVGRGEGAVVDGGRIEVDRVVPQEVVVAVVVDADLARVAAAAGRIAVLAPHRIDRLAVVPTVRVDVREDDQLDPLEDPPDLGGGERRPAVDQPGAGRPRLQEIGRQVEDDVRASPLARVGAADEQDAGPLTRARGDPEGVALASLSRDERQGDHLGGRWVRRAESDDRRLDLGDVEKGHRGCPPFSGSAPCPSSLRPGFRPRPRGWTRPPSNRSPSETSAIRC